MLLVTVLIPRSLAYGLARFFARGFYRSAGIESLAPPLEGSGPQIFRGQCCDGWFFLQKAGLLRVTTEKVVEFVERGLVLEKGGEVEADLLVVAREFFYFSIFFFFFFFRFSVSLSFSRFLFLSSRFSPSFNRIEKQINQPQKSATSSTGPLLSSLASPPTPTPLTPRRRRRRRRRGPPETPPETPRRPARP